MSLSNKIFNNKVKEELESLISELKENEATDEIVEKYTELIVADAIKYRDQAFKRVLLGMYDQDLEKLKTNIAKIALLDAWGGDANKTLAVVYPAIGKFVGDITAELLDTTL